MDKAAQAMVALWERITLDIDRLDPALEPWPYPFKNGVRGWEGTAPVLFVGSNPSTNTRWDGTPAQRLYDALHTHGLQDAHLTDLVKARADYRSVDVLFGNHALIACSRRHLLKEIAILRRAHGRCLIVALGGTAGRYASNWLRTLKRTDGWQIPHYSQRGRFNLEILQALPVIRMWLDQLQGRAAGQSGRPVQPSAGLIWLWSHRSGGRGEKGDVTAEAS